MASEHRLIDVDYAIDLLGCEDEDIAIKHFLEELPTVDAVEVVRCKDCKFWVEGRHHTGRCNALIQFHDAERYATDEGHFCSYGERRTNGSVHI